jgi:hypothetical protein
VISTLRRALCVVLFAASAVTSTSDAGATNRVTFSEKGVAIDFIGGTWAAKSDYLALRAQQDAQLVRQLGGNAVSISFPIYTLGWRSDSVFAGLNPTGKYGTASPTIDQMATVIRIFQSYNLRITLRPLMNEELLGTHWRGTIQPVDARQWFDAYRRTIRPYLVLAAQRHVAGFALQSELMDLAYSPQWLPTARWAAHLFPGTLVWDSTVNTLMAPAPLPSLQQWVDTYPPIPTAPTNATIEELVRGWNAFIKPLHVPGQPSTSAIGEVGILAQQGAFRQPSLHTLTTPFDQSVQSRWFNAACLYASSHQYHRLYFWAMLLAAAPPSWTTPNTRYPMTFQPQGLRAIQSCFLRH